MSADVVSIKVIENFYDEVAEKSPLPIVIYNFPGVRPAFGTAVSCKV